MKSPVAQGLAAVPQPLGTLAAGPAPTTDHVYPFEGVYRSDLQEPLSQAPVVQSAPSFPAVVVQAPVASEQVATWQVFEEVQVAEDNVSLAVQVTLLPDTHTFPLALIAAPAFVEQAALAATQ